MAINNNGSLSFEVKLELDKLRADVKHATAEMAKIGKSATDEGKKIDSAFSGISKTIASIGTAFSAQQLIQQIVKVRGEFEKLEVSFATMLRSEERASALMNQLVSTAATTPFGLQDVAGGAKQLLAYGMEAEKINDTLIRLGDIAAGLSIPLGDMTYLFGTTMVQGRMYTQDLNQFVGRGIPLIKEFAEQFGVAESEVKNLVTEGKIGFPELQKAIMSMTSEGGQFAGLMEAQSKTIAGQIANLEDAIDSMFNSIGKANEGIISDTIGIASKLVENYEQVIKILVTLVGTYGAYRLALLSVAAAQKLALLATMTQEWYAMGKALGFATANQIMFNNASKANIYVALATAILGVVVAVKAFSKSENESKKVIDECNEKIQQQQKELEELEKRENAVAEAEKNAAQNTASEINRIELLVSAIHDETNSLDDRRKAIKELQSIVPNYNASIDDEGRLYRENTQSVEDYIDSLNRLAIAKALQSKREELVSKRISAEMDRRRAVKEEEYAQKGVDTANKNRDKARQEYDDKMDEWEKSTNKSRNIFVRAAFSTPEGQAAMQGTSEIERTALNAAEQRVEVAEKLLETAQGAIKVADGEIKATSEDLALLDDSMKGYSDELKQINKPKPTTTGGGSGNNADNQAKKEAERKLKLQQELADELLDQQKANEQAEIDLMEEGSAKRLRQIRYDFKVRKAEIEKQEKDWKKQNIEAGIATGENGLTEEQTRAINIANRQNEQSRSKSVAEVRADEKRSMNEYLAEYGSLQEQKLALAELYAEKIANAVNDGEKKALQAQYRDAVSAIDIEINKSVSVISKAFGDMSEKTSKELRTIADDAEAAYKFLQGGEWSDEKGMLFGMSKDTFDSLRLNNQQMEELANIIKRLRNDADDAAVGFDKIKQGLDKLKDAGNDVEKLREAIALLKQGFDDYGNAIGFVGDALGKLGDAFGNDTLSDISEGINGVLGAMDSAFKGAEAGTIFGPIGMAAGAALGFVSSLAQSIGQLFDKKHERKIKALQGQIDDLGRAYDRLGDTLDNVYSRDAAAILKEQNVNLAKQKALIQQQIKEEEAKWKTDKDKIKAWRDELADIDAQMQENRIAAVDAIFGQDVNTAIENFADAWGSAWSEGTSKVKAAKDMVRDMMKSMVNESVKATIESSDAMEKIRTKLQQFYADNVLTVAEQDTIIKMAEDLQRELDAQYGWAENLYRDTYSQEGSSRGFESMSQDTASELNGRFATMVELQAKQLNKSAEISIDTSAIRQTMQLTATNVEEIRNMSLLSIGHLERIAKNTNELYGINNRLAKIEEYTSRL